MRWPIRSATFDAVGRRVATRQPAPAALARAPARASASGSRAGTSGCRRCAGRAPARAAPASSAATPSESISAPTCAGGERLQHLQPRAVGAEQLRRGRACAAGVQLVRAGRRRSSAGRGRRRRAAASPRRWRCRRTAGRRPPGPPRHRQAPGAAADLESRRRSACVAALRAAAAPGRARAADARARSPTSCASGPRSRASSWRSSRDSSVCGTRASPGRASTASAPGRALGEVADQPALAETGLAGDQARRPADQAASSACHSASRPIRRGGRSTLTGSGRGWLASARQAAGVDAGAQRLGLGIGGDAEDPLQHVAAAVERGQRRRPVAAQVVQAHQAAMGVLGGRVGSRAGARPRRAPATSRPALSSRDRFVGEGADAAGTTLLARQRQPVGELAAHRLGEAVQQLARIRVGADRGGRRCRRTGRRRRRLRAARGRAPCAGGTGAGAGWRGRARGSTSGQSRAASRLARRRPFDRQVGEQQRVLLLERDDRAVGAHELRLAGELQGVAAVRRRSRRIGTRNQLGGGRASEAGSATTRAERS